MKNLKHKLKNSLLLFASLLLASCSEELFDNHLHNHDVDKNQITFKQFKNETGLKDFNSVKSVKISSENSRMSDSEFLTDTTKVLKHTSSTNKVTYSFKIYPLFEELNSKAYYNLVYEKIGTEWNEIIFFNTKKSNPTDARDLESSEMVYNKNLSAMIMSGFCEVTTYTNESCTCNDKNNCDWCNECVTSTVSYFYCGSQLFSGSHPIESIIAGGSPGGGIGEYDGIYIPNPYDGEADLNNAEFLLAVQVANFTKKLPANLKNLMANNFWFYPNILDFIKNNGGLTQANKDAVVFILSNIEAIFTTISQNPNDLTSTQINEIKYNAFIFLLQNGTWLAGQSATTQQSIKNYLIANSFSNESEEFIGEVKNLSIDLDINAMEIWDNIQEYRSGMSNDEKLIFDNINKTKQLRYLSAGYKAMKKAEELYPNNIILSNLHNGKGDAFRHAAWNGLSSLLLGHDLTQSLTTAHESKPSQYTFNFKEKEMDLFNNEKGLIVAGFSNLSNIFTNINQYCILGYLRYLNELD